METDKQTFTRHESDGAHLVQQHVRLIDGRSLLWTRDNITKKCVTFKGAQKAIAKLNADKYGGFEDWRLPTVEELFLLADRKKFSPAIDKEFFPGCESGSYWSGTVDASAPSGCAWFVYFNSGYSDWNLQDYGCFVRAVRSSQ